MRGCWARRQTLLAKVRNISLNTLKTELLCRRLLNTSLLFGKSVLKRVEENRHRFGTRCCTAFAALVYCKRRHVGTEIQARKCDVLYVYHNFITSKPLYEQEMLTVPEDKSERICKHSCLYGNLKLLSEYFYV